MENKIKKEFLEYLAKENITLSKDEESLALKFFFAGYNLGERERFKTCWEEQNQK